MAKTEHRPPTDETGRACPLCRADRARLYLRADGRDYLHCPVCRLVFVPPEFWPAPDEARARYEQHQNSVRDEKYAAFLKRLGAPLADRLPRGARGLDLGAGPASAPAPVGSALCAILRDAGMDCLPFDPFFFPRMPDGPFDFIASSETFEHFRQPRREIGRIRQHLKAGGLLGVMTAFWEEASFRNNWHYRRDFTHLCFYRAETFAWIQRNFGFARLWTDHRRVIILQETLSLPSPAPMMRRTSGERRGPRHFGKPRPPLSPPRPVWHSLPWQPFVDPPEGSTPCRR